MDTFGTALSATEKYGIIGLLFVIGAGLVVAVIQLYRRNQQLIDRHVDERIKEREQAATHWAEQKAQGDKMLFILERLAAGPGAKP